MFFFEYLCVYLLENRSSNLLSKTLQSLRDRIFSERMERGGSLEYYKALREGRKNTILTQPKSSNPAPVTA